MVASGDGISSIMSALLTFFVSCLGKLNKGLCERMKMDINSHACCAIGERITEISFYVCGYVVL